MAFSTIALFLALIFFLLAIVFKLNEKKLSLQHSQYVDSFIKQMEIQVSHIYIGIQFSLIHDKMKKTIWFCAFQKGKLQYKEIPYDNIHQVIWQIDGTPIQTCTKDKPSKVELLTNKEHFYHSSKNQIVHEQYRVKESILTLILDENPRQTLDLLLFSSNLPKHFKDVKEMDVGKWYEIFTSIIKEEEQNSSSSAK